MLLSKLSRGALATVLAGLAALFFCSDVLHNIDHWGQYDWDLFFFHTHSVYRSVAEFGELPLWNPWYCGGFPMIGNPQAASLDPFFLLDLLIGPIVAIKLKIVAHYAIGLGGMYWCCRQMGLSLLASVYAAGTFLFSTWLASISTLDTCGALRRFTFHGPLDCSTGAASSCPRRSTPDSFWL